MISINFATESCSEGSIGIGKGVVPGITCVRDPDASSRVISVSQCTAGSTQPNGPVRGVGGSEKRSSGTGRSLCRAEVLGHWTKVGALVTRIP